ncbi:GNAT family N-acetyltransferase [Alkalicella caledoniensis]|uniref:GNAT family N-acetyltransferase n=1 Tax=Alkalicella caledoniensis TaxID=2731377 RepID=A0A7G9W8R0_ALKCA|nr:GNAT family protein [Alkalicella caledoniensis]QNO15072.1 GNAT family N-acetyltransferase [Alkalicella caledoniensis]
MFSKAFFEFPTLETGRLILREIKVEDIEQVYEIFKSEEVAEFSSHYPVKSKGHILKAINRWRFEYADKIQVRWGIARKEDNLIIGTCCLGDFDEESKRCEIGYHLSHHQWNKGYMTEALKEIVRFGFEDNDVNRIEAFVTPQNQSSVTVLKKIGFVEEGLLRERDFFKGQFQDGIVLGMLKKDYILLLNEMHKQS